MCSKRDGVCSIQLYADADGAAEIVGGLTGRLRTLCPSRFEENGEIFRWVGKELLGTDKPTVLGEIAFLRRIRKLVALEGGIEQGGTEGQAQEVNEDQSDDAGREDVGRIDNILVHQSAEGDILDWCALEIQAVYFSGKGMRPELGPIAATPAPGLPFPAQNHRPDYRSSGPKRLMPQLQIKVPALRRWGKKMAVVIDEDFYETLSDMREDKVNDVSNADVVWFVVAYERQGDTARLVRRGTHLTTLERAVEGLTAGEAVSKATFEGRIRQKLRAQ